MRSIFDKVSEDSSRIVTESYSTSFNSAVKLLGKDIRQDVHNIYGFVRFADEIVDTFHDTDQTLLLDQFRKEFYQSLEQGISLNPIINSFQLTVKKYNIDLELVEAFLTSMEMDLSKKEYETYEDYEKYIYGSADVVGLMCLKIFVHGDEEKYQELKLMAKSLGSAFQKVNFLRDLKDDVEILERSYFPNLDLGNLTAEEKTQIIEEIEGDFKLAYEGIKKLPRSSRLGVYTAYRYYGRLLQNLKQTHHKEIMKTRIRVSDPMKLTLMMKSYCRVKLNWI